MRIHLPPIWGMSGVLNFFGEGFPFHRLLKAIFGKYFTFEGVLLVTKTATLPFNEGNMPMKEDGTTPKESMPACIVLGPWQFIMGVMLNAVGLSGPGIASLLAKGIWQQRREPFMISFMSIAKGGNDEATVKLHLEEFEKFLIILARSVPQFLAQFLLQINVSCPNVGHTKKSDALVFQEAWGYLELLKKYLPHVQCVFKVNIFMPVITAVQLSRHPQFAGVCVTNTLPWSTLTRFQQIFYFPVSIFTGKSPLARFGGGGLSGRPLLKKVEEWVRDARNQGFKKHINAGGGILSVKHIDRLKEAGADSVSIGSVALLRPWRLRSIIHRAYLVFGVGTTLSTDENYLKLGQ